METKRLMRSRKNSMLGGVCTGLGNYFSIDPTLVRLVFILMVLAGGSGVLIYLVLWIVMPREDTVNVLPLDGPEFGRRAQQMGEEMRDVATNNNTRVIQIAGIGLVILGLFYLVRNVFPWMHWFGDAIFWPGVLVIVGGFMLYTALKKG